MNKEQPLRSHSFRLESDLVHELDNQIRAGEAVRNGMVDGIARECSAGRVIPDLIAWWSSGCANERPQESLTTAECVLLSYLRRNGPSRIDILEARCGLSRGLLRNGALDRLEMWGLLARGPGGQVRLTERWPPAIEIVAFEAKLTRWKEAVEQARAYRSFADRVYVVVPDALLITVREQLDSFASAGVGLLAVGVGSLVELCEADVVPNSEHDWRRELVLSRAVDADRIGSERHDNRRTRRDIGVAAPT